MTEIESPTLLRRQLGRFLREAREGRGLTIAIAAKEVQLSFNGLQRLETGRAVKPRRQDVRELCMLYEVNPEQTEQAVGLASRAATARDEDGTRTGSLRSAGCSRMPSTCTSAWSGQLGG
ncbi:helix-turn-helix domain-containing protein [Nocardia abscessus]|uniref:helix-turn-helix domain-containing protein n=1 Tax=Nocardia abscessus TaxID=120957 RepID=UPI0018938E4E|nr:helix-turn-helix transcriptional regulator [Nocardia abscessus]MBF6219911.1 helix-turn-helix domain-containing protein [Nocardia abscessus]